MEKAMYMSFKDKITHIFKNDKLLEIVITIKLS